MPPKVFKLALILSLFKKYRLSDCNIAFKAKTYVGYETVKGALIAVEGIDGSGLTTHSRLLADALTSAGCPSVYTKEPTDGPIGQVIRSQLSGQSPDPVLMALLFAADRAWHVFHDPTLPGGRGMEGALGLGFLVVTDRYKYSSIAYQGAAGVPTAWLWELNSFAREADIIVYIDVPVELSVARLSARGRREAFERAEFLVAVKRRFEEVLRGAEARGVRVLRVRGAEGGSARPVEEVSQEVFRGVTDALGYCNR